MITIRHFMGAVKCNFPQPSCHGFRKFLLVSAPDLIDSHKPDMNLTFGDGRKPLSTSQELVKTPSSRSRYVDRFPLEAKSSMRKRSPLPLEEQKPLSQPDKVFMP
ncbi:hypothetical protein V6N13_073485 [Hibiscus sabdariffa]